MSGKSKQKTKFFIYNEVVIHNKPEDFWVVIHGHVLNLTPMIKDRKDSWNVTLEYLMAFGGKSLSKYFHETGMPRTEISPNTGKPRVLFPPIVEKAESEFCRSKDVIWSIDPFYHIGKLTKQERPLRIINTLTGKTQHMVVCEEDTIYDIQRKYKKYNSHAGSYIWRKNYKNCSESGLLNLNNTLTENGIFKEKFGAAPAIWLFYTDDLTMG